MPSAAREDRCVGSIYPQESGISCFGRILGECPTNGPGGPTSHSQKYRRLSAGKWLETVAMSAQDPNRHDSDLGIPLGHMIRTSSALTIGDRKSVV